MLPELGQICLILALLLSICLGICPLIGVQRSQSALLEMAKPLSSGVFGFLAVAFALLTYAFVQQDFSVAYVAQNSNSLLPMHYRFSAVWGAHEGSLLLWCLIFCLLYTSPSPRD